MSTNNTATVEVLTAEVRALMVGSRQVTLSVYRQLDLVSRERMEPFGRVCDNKIEKESDISLVGRDALNGTLVSTVLSRPTWTGFSPSLQHYVFHTDRPGLGARYTPFDPFQGHVLRYSTDRGFLCKAPPLDGQVDPSWPRGDEPNVEELRLEYRSIRDANDKRRQEHLAAWLRGDFCQLVALHSQWNDEAHEDYETYKRAQRYYDQAAALPLIVLAGLR